MALKIGAAVEVIAENTAGLVAAGYTQDRAAVIAEAFARNWQEQENARRDGMRSVADVQMRDREGTSAFFTTEQLGKTRYLTPEGFLVCVGVPLARTGDQVYTESELNGPGEVRIRGNADGIVIVRRLPEEVFSSETIASFEGKPITIDHPTEFVTPENHALLAVGHVQNVRQGSGIEDDLLLGDCVITAADAIAYVNRELPECSAGYKADYEQDEPGIAYQRRIRGNHEALVKRGRAGPRVSIKDSIASGVPRMKVRDFIKSFLNLPTNDNAAVTGALDAEVPGITATQPTNDTASVLAEVQKLAAQIGTLDAQVKDIAAKQAKVTKDEDEETEEERKAREAKEKEAKDEEAVAEMEKTGDTILEAESPGAVLNLGTVYTGDSAGKADVLKEIGSRAEILAPGVSMPTRDSIKGTRGVALATFMRATLERATTTDAGKEALKTFLMGRKIADLKGHALVGVFNGATELVRVRNNQGTQRMAGAQKTTDFGPRKSIDEINTGNREFWKKQRAG